MPASEKGFDAAVAIRLARTVEQHPQHLPLLVDYVRQRVAMHAGSLVQVAQQGGGAMGQALQECVAHLDEVALEALFNALPVRTVQLRALAIAVAMRMAAVDTRTTGFGGIVLRSQVGARLREGGQPEAALTVLDELVASLPFGRAPNAVQAHVLANFGTVLADLARDQDSMDAHTRALELLRPTAARPLQPDAVHLFTSELANAAAAAMRLGRHAPARALLDEASLWVLRADDKGLALRIQLLQLTHLAETDQLDKALALGRQLLEHAADLEEIDSQAFLASLVDVFLNVGSVLLDLNRAGDALSYLRSADQVARRIHAQAPAPLSRLKCVTARVALLNTQLVLGVHGIAEQSRLLLQESQECLRLHPSDYVREVHARALQIAVQTATDDEAERPSVDDVTLMLALDEAANGPSGAQNPDRLLRALHVAAMAYAKLERDDLALQCAQRAIAVAEAREPSETLLQRAHRAVLTDSLSRRFFAVGQDAQGIDAAEAAARLLIPCWRERPEAYWEWLQRMLARFEMLCTESSTVERFERLIEKELRGQDPAA